MSGNFEIELEIPPGVNQQDLWNLEKELDQIKGVEKANLIESRDLVSATLLLITFIPTAVVYVKQGVDTVANFRSTARKLHELLHPNEKKSEKDEAARKKIILKQPNGAVVELYNYSLEEIEELLVNSLPKGQ